MLWLGMENIPSAATNNAERSPERILTSEEVLEALSQYAEGFTLGRELSDEKGVYLREVSVAGPAEGEVTEYQYMRRGAHPNQNQMDQTALHVIYYQDGIPVGSERLAIYSEETGEWKKL